MHDNHLYNLLNQLVEEHKGLWRIKNQYPKDAESCSDCQELWTKLAKRKEETVKELTGLVKSHLS